MVLVPVSHILKDAKDEFIYPIGALKLAMVHVYYSWSSRICLLRPPKGGNVATEDRFHTAYIPLRHRLRMLNLRCIAQCVMV